MRKLINWWKRRRLQREIEYCRWQVCRPGTKDHMRACYMDDLRRAESALEALR